MVSPEVARQFLEANWLPEMNADARRTVLEALDEHQVAARTELLHQGRPNDLVFFLVKGRVEITRDVPNHSPTVLVSIDAPSLFGLTTFFRNAPPDFSARTATDVTYLTLGRDAHRRLRESRPAAAEQLALAAIHVLSDRIAMLDQRMTEVLADHDADSPPATEWSRFRARLFDESIL